jgi:hypothetical protein
MLFLHEVHRVAGTTARDFEAAIRDEYRRILAADDRARLLWFLHQAHGTGPAYTVVTITAFADAAAWGDLAVRLHAGDLHGWAAELDTLRHEVSGKLLFSTPWSPMAPVDLTGLTELHEHEPTLYMEDTGWPFEGRLDDYVALLGDLYEPMLRGSKLLEMQASFQPAFGMYKRAEVILMQKVHDHRALLALLEREEPDAYPADSWMVRALDVRDHWESRLLRTAPWSPLY